MTLQDCYDKTRKLLNYYTSRGAIQPMDMDDTWPRAAALLDTAQKEFARLRPMLSSWMLTQIRMENLLPELAPVLVSTQPVTMKATGSASLTFVTDGPLDVTVTQVFRGNPMELARVSCPAGGNTTYALTYSGYAGGGDIMINFFGGPAYVWNIAAYATYYQDTADVPAYGDYRWQALPEDCIRVEGITLRPNVGKVVPEFRDYRLRERQIGLPWDFEGTAAMVYERAPRPVTEDTAMSSVLDVDDVAAEGMSYFAAAYLVAEENPALFELFMAVYRDLLINTVPDVDAKSQLNTLYYQRTRRLKR